MLILEVENSIFRNTKNFFWDGFFCFQAWTVKVHQIAPFYTTLVNLTLRY